MSKDTAESYDRLRAILGVTRNTRIIIPCSGCGIGCHPIGNGCHCVKCVAWMRIAGDGQWYQPNSETTCDELIALLVARSIGT